MTKKLEPGGRRYQTGKHLEAFLLLFLHKKSVHGGALLAQLEETLPPEWVIDSGRVYRMLRDLESRGELMSRWVIEDGGAPIRVYEITPKGLDKLTEWYRDIRVRLQSLKTFLDLYRDAGLPNEDSFTV